VPNQTQALADALERLLARDERNTCQHQETHRGGAIWTICDDCGCKWADDKGGMPKWKDPPEWTAARKALAAHRATQQAQASESAEARDAARYRWLRSPAWDREVCMRISEDGFAGHFTALFGERLDAEIDAAIAATKEQA